MTIRTPTADPLLPWRPLGFWSLNYRMSPERMREDVRRMAAIGWGGCFLHARAGLASDYMGKDWLESLDAAIDECARFGLQAWLYDEDRWPSGMGGGTVALRDPNLRMHQIAERPDSDTNITSDAPAQGQGLPQWQATTGEFLHRHGGKAYVLERHSTDRTWAPDILDPEAAQVFIECTYEAYAARYGAQFGGRVSGIFMDEPNIAQQFYDAKTPALAWSRRLRERFQARWGYDLVPQLHLLFHQGPGATKVRYHYRRLIDEVMVASFIAPIASWCRAHGLPFTGHMTCEESLYSQVVYSGSVMDALEHFDVPGLDMLGRKTDELITALQASSVARQCGRARVQSELFGLAGYGATPADLRWIADWHLALGVNQFCLHIANQSLVGGRKHDCPPNLFHQQPWFPAWGPLSDHLARASAALAIAPAHIDVAVLHPVESAWVQIEQDDGSGGVFPHDHRSIWDLQHGFYQVLEHLVGIQHTPDLISESRLERDASAAAGQLRVGAVTYRVVVLSPLISVRPTTVTMLEKFVADGGIVLSVGALPTQRCGEDDPALAARLARVVRSIGNTRAALRQELDQILTPGVRLVGDHPKIMLRWTCSADGNFTALVVNNDRLTAHTIEVEIADTVTTAALAELDTASGAHRAITTSSGRNVRRARLEIPPGTTRLVVTAPADAPARVSPNGAPLALGRNQAWELRLNQPNALPLERLRYRCGSDQPWSELLPPRTIQAQLEAALHRGPVFVAAEFENTLLVGAAVDAMIECGRDHVIGVNGTPLPPHTDHGTWLDPDFPRFPIGHLLRPGNNRIEVAIDFRKPNLYSPLGMPRHPGTEIEPIVLLGAFAVPLVAPATAAPLDPDADLFGLPPHRLLVAQPASRLAVLPTHSTGNLIADGLPRFGGTVTLARTITWQPGHGTVLDLAPAACAVVCVTLNGSTIATIDHAPWTIDLAPWLKSGANRLEITLSNTLRNHFMTLGGCGGYDLNEWGYGYHASSAFMERRRQRPASSPPTLAPGHLVLARFGWDA